MDCGLDCCGLRDITSEHRSAIGRPRTYDLNLTLPGETLGAFKRTRPGSSHTKLNCTSMIAAHLTHGGSPGPMAGERGIYAALIGIRSMLSP